MTNQSQEKSLINDMDAKRWAKEFVDTWRNVVPNQPPPEEDWMHTWFANAIMCGYDEAMRRTRNLPLTEDSVALAAQCWCQPETASIEMDTRLANAVAKTIEYVKFRPSPDEPLLQQALEALEKVNQCECDPEIRFTCGYCSQLEQTITALKARLKTKEKTNL